MRRRARVDHNQQEIVGALRALGAQVKSLHRFGDGLPDLLVKYRGHLFLVEVKNGERRGRLNKKQQEFHAQWGPFNVLSSVDDAITWVQEWDI